MSEVLFLITDKRISDEIQNRKKVFTSYGQLRTIGIIKADDLIAAYNLSGQGYFFDCMCIPFSCSYEKKRNASLERKKIQEWICLLIIELLEKHYKIKLFRGSCGIEYGKVADKEKVVKVDELKNGEVIFDYCTLYNIII